MAATQAANSAPVEELLHGSFETPEWADDPLEPSGEETGDPVDEPERVTEPHAAPPLPDLSCIEITISGRGFGQAGPFFVTAETFHKLCFAARNREVAQ